MKKLALAAAVCAIAAAPALANGGREADEKQVRVDLVGWVQSECTIAFNGDAARQTVQFEINTDQRPKIDIGILTAGCNGPYAIYATSKKGGLVRVNQYGDVQGGQPSNRFAYRLTRGGSNGFADEDFLVNEQNRDVAFQIGGSNRYNFLDNNARTEAVNLNISFGDSTAEWEGAMVAGDYIDTLVFTVKADPNTWGFDNPAARS